MLTVYNEDHRLHDGGQELLGGALVRTLETPTRADAVLARVREIRLGGVLPPRKWGVDPVLRVHSPGYLQFLSTVHDRWRGSYGDTAALPQAWCRRGIRAIEPESLQGKLGYFSADAAAPIVAGTWKAALSASDVALTGRELVQNGLPGAFALTRPPGHHASRDLCGGYCYLNNAAIAAQSFLDHGAVRVAILDIDYHHGNGTQAIFYDRPDVLFVSLHADPARTYPYFSGFADETGYGLGEGYNLNYPLPPGTSWTAYAEALAAALKRITSYCPNALVVSLGVDTCESDPLSDFRLRTGDFTELGRRVARLGLPTLIVLEGGYATESLGINVVNVLTGFDEISVGEGKDRVSSIPDPPRM